MHSSLAGGTYSEASSVRSQWFVEWCSQLLCVGIIVRVEGWGGGGAVCDQVMALAHKGGARRSEAIPAGVSPSFSSQDWASEYNLMHAALSCIAGASQHSKQAKMAKSAACSPAFLPQPGLRLPWGPSPNLGLAANHTAEERGGGGGAIQIEAIVLACICLRLFRNIFC